MSVGDKRRESHPAREGGQAHKKTGTFPSHQGGKESRPQGKDHALHSQQTLPTLQQTYTEKHTCSHTHRHTIHAHMCRHTDSHTGLPVVDTRASVLSSESTGSRTMPCQTGGGERTSSIPGSISCCRLGRVRGSPGSSYVVIESHQTQGIRNKQTLHNVPPPTNRLLVSKETLPLHNNPEQLQQFRNLSGHWPTKVLTQEGASKRLTPQRSSDGSQCVGHRNNK